MGFKLIRDKSADERQRLEEAYASELEKEIGRWSRMTASAEREKPLLNRFALVKKNRPTEQSPEEMANALSNNIRNNHKSLVQAQGNMDLEKLMDLLS